MKSSIRTAFAISATALLTACAVGPDYRRPEGRTPDEFIAVERVHISTDEIEGEFWKSFGDPQLNQLIERALTANHDIRIATARLREARALGGEARLDLAPAVTSGFAHTDTRASERQTGAAGLARDEQYYESGFDAFWELDFFGRVRRGVEASAAATQSAEAAVYATQVSITAEAARRYFELRGAQQRLAVAQRNADNQRETLRITTVRLNEGRGTQLDASRAQAQLSATLATIPDFEGSITQAMLRLGVLIGEAPRTLITELSASRALPSAPVVQNIGAPETLLRRRPDVIGAERDLAAATARVGVAVADLFPRVSFVGRFGFDALDRGSLGDASSETWSFGPSIQWAALDLGRVRQRIHQREAAADGALAKYEQTVLRALEETDASLTAYSKALAKQEHVQASAAASLEAAALARVRFEHGATDFLTVLDAERSALAAEDQLAQSEIQTATTLLAMYKALGGGFRPLGARTARARRQ